MISPIGNKCGVNGSYFSTLEEYADHLQAISNFSYWVGRIQLFLAKREAHKLLAMDAETIQEIALESLEFIIQRLGELDYPETFNHAVDHNRLQSAFLPGVTENQAVAFNESLKATKDMNQSDAILDSLSCISAFYLHIYKFLSRLIAAFENHPDQRLLVLMPMYASSVVSRAFTEIQQYILVKSQETITQSPKVTGNE